MWRCVFVVLSLGAPLAALAQGCVVTRGSGIQPFEVAPGEYAGSVAGQWRTAISHRYLNSDRHFVGSEEQVERGHEGSQVINRSHFIDVSLSYSFTERFSATLTLPYATHDRSSVVRKNDAARTILHRYSTQNAGLADVRLMGTGWLLDPATHARGNVLLGIGLDIPTGSDDAQDTFETYDAPTRSIVGVRRTVDQSIQLGDGGWGLLLDLYAYGRVAPRVLVYGGASYALTPEETNGVPTFRGNPFEAVMSIPDAYVARAGFEYLLWPAHTLTFSLGARIEGVPAHDVVGGSDGFRRPGYAVSIEPGVAARFGPLALSLYAPQAIYRNRERSVPDRQQTAATGVFRHGDAAFADGLVMFSATIAF